MYLTLLKMQANHLEKRLEDINKDSKIKEEKISLHLIVLNMKLLLSQITLLINVP